VGGLGAIGIIFTFVVGVLPPGFYTHTWGYIFVVTFGTFVLAVPPLFFLRMKKPEWQRTQDKND